MSTYSRHFTILRYYCELWYLNGRKQYHFVLGNSYSWIMLTASLKSNLKYWKWKKVVCHLTHLLSFWVWLCWVSELNSNQSAVFAYTVGFQDLWVTGEMVKPGLKSFRSFQLRFARNELTFMTKFLRELFRCQLQHFDLLQNNVLHWSSQWMASANSIVLLLKRFYPTWDAFGFFCSEAKKRFFDKLAAKHTIYESFEKSKFLIEWI